MFEDGILDHVPIWLFFVAIVLIALLPMEAGQRLGQWRRGIAEHEGEGPVGNVVAATLALLGFMLALTLGAATVRFDARKEALIEGVNAIESAYRNAALLPEPHKTESRKLLREWTETRLSMHESYSNPDDMAKLESRVRPIQDELWTQAEALAGQDRNSEVYAMFASSLNDVLKIHNKRVILGAVYRIPLMVWVVLIVATMLSTFGVGFHFGLAGTRSPAANLTLALTFALVMTIIFDIDEPGKGVISVNQRPMYELFERMKAKE